MKELSHKLSTVTQNLLLGTVTGIVVGNSLRYVMVYEGASDWIWIMFFILGPLLGYFSGRERERLDALQKEKQDMEDQFNKIKSTLKKSANRYRLLVEQANDAIYLTTVGGRFLMFNEATSLLSGYRTEELKKMTLETLRHKKEGQENEDILLDNKVCRYEDKWKTKSGDIAHLDVIAKWVQISGHRLILHVGRNIRKWQIAEEDTRAAEIQAFQKDKLTDTANIYKSVYKEVVDPIENTIKTLNNMMKDLPEKQEEITEILSTWNKTRKSMQSMALKSTRDIKSSPSQWDLNKVIIQELQHLKSVTHFRGVMIRTSLSSDINPVLGFGIDYSLALGTLFKAAMESLHNTEKKELLISTRPMKDHILMEIQTSSDQYFEEYLARLVDPLYSSGDSEDRQESNIGISVLKYYFESFGGKLDIAQSENGLLVRIRVPSMQDDESVKRKIVSESEKNSAIL